MTLSNTHRFAIAICFLLLTFSFSESDNEKRRYSKEPTIIDDQNQEQVLVIVHQDTLSDDVLYMVRSSNNIPLHYFRSISTDVCFDNECRLLNITVFWNITGRYLGFELSDGEFLSKRDHEPFSNEEYERLNDLLADPALPLGGVSFEALIETPEADAVDAVSGATTADVSKMVVKGAAYTTYTLWNMVHGPIRDQVAALTEKQLSPDLIDLILKSPDISDRVWALHRITQNTVLTPALTASLLALIAGDDFYLAYSAIRAIKTPHLEANPLQSALFSIYRQADHGIRSMIVDKLMEASYLSSEVTKNSRKLLGELNGKQLGDILKLYARHAVSDLETCRAVAEMLKNENHFISRQAYSFLKASPVVYEEIIFLLNDYEQRD